MNRTRDLALAAVAACSAAALAVCAFVDPPAADGIITGIVALGVGALGRISGANTQTPPSDGGQA